MKKPTKIMLTGLCAVLLVVASVMGTMAYLTSQTEIVKNTFTVGKLNITLDEADTDEYGQPIPDAARVPGNDYKLIPGHVYTKDPTVHVESNSEACYVFVDLKMPNNGVFAGSVVADPDGDGFGERIDTDIAKQIRANGWVAMENGMLYKAVSAEDAAAGTDLELFHTFGVDQKKTEEQLTALTVKGCEITITAYACQQDGFDSAEAAWNATFGNK